MATLILSITALVVAVVALIIALSRQTMKVVKETTKEIVKEEHFAPVDNPFYYDGQEEMYMLDGDLHVRGTLSCLNRKEA